MREEAALDLKKKGKGGKNVAIATTSEVQQQGMFMMSVWVATVFILWLFSNPAASNAVFAKHGQLQVMYGATSVAFAFATALDILAYVNAVSDEKVFASCCAHFASLPLLV